MLGLLAARPETETLREAARRIATASRAAQGLPPMVTDPTILARVAAMLWPPAGDQSMPGRERSQHSAPPGRRPDRKAS